VEGGKGNEMESMEWEIQREVLWMTGINYLVDATIEQVEALYPSHGIAATNGYVSKKDLFCRVEFEGSEYTAISGSSENTKGDLLRYKIDTRAGGDTRYGLNKVMKQAFNKFGGLQVKLISRNAMTYRII
jgi:hypothetical protein